jgi:hypothetical protein
MVSEIQGGATLPRADLTNRFVVWTVKAAPPFHARLADDASSWRWTLPDASLL